MVTGNIRHYAWRSIEKLKKVTEPRPGEEIFGIMITLKGKTLLVAIDTNVQDFLCLRKTCESLQSHVSRVARLFGFEPKARFSIAFSLLESHSLKNILSMLEQQLNC